VLILAACERIRKVDSRAVDTNIFLAVGSRLNEADLACRR
jgi:hypothetical protein